MDNTLNFSKSSYAKTTETFISTYCRGVRSTIFKTKRIVVSSKIFSGRSPNVVLSEPIYNAR